jgi:soluble lytic murein transglycosylase-like protein
MPIILLVFGVVAFVMYVLYSSSNADSEAFQEGVYPEESFNFGDEDVAVESFNFANEDIGNMTNEELVNKYAAEKNIDPSLVKAIIKTESSWNSNATGSVGEQGLMQLKPEYFGSAGDLYDPETNIKTGTNLLATLLSKYPKETAIQMYNVGEQGYLSGKRNTAYLAQVLINQKGYA